MNICCDSRHFQILGCFFSSLYVIPLTSHVYSKAFFIHLQPIISGIIFGNNLFYTFVLASPTGPDRDKKNMDTLEPEL